MEHQVARTARITRLVVSANGEPSVVYELDVLVRAGDTLGVDLTAGVVTATPATNGRRRPMARTRALGQPGLPSQVSAPPDER
jgi:hypothetical protein